MSVNNPVLKLTRDVIPIGCSQPVSETLPKSVQQIAETLHPTKIILFGSYARGTPSRDSDVDLLVIIESNAPKKELHWAVSSLLIPRPYPVDILVRTPEEIELALKRGDLFIRDIITHGQVLYERAN